jgi:type I restriction enzyme R subunit
MPTSSDSTYPDPAPQHLVLKEQGIEDGFVEKLRSLKYEYRPDITDRAKLEQNFREKFEALNRVRLTDGEFARLLDEIVTPDVFTAARPLRQINAFIARFSQQGPGKTKMSREQLIGLIQSDAKFMNEREDIAAYINTLKPGQGLAETAIRDGYTRFKTEKDAAELATIAARHHLATTALQTFVDGILARMIFDGEQLSDLMAPLDLGWKARTQAELALMEDLHLLLTKRAQGRDISGLSAYE